MRRLMPFILGLAVACGSDSSTQLIPTPASLAGTWALQNINGALLPFTLSQTASTKQELLSDVVTAVATGTYTEVAQLRTTVNGQATLSTESDTGTYTLVGSALTIRSSDGSVINGTLNASSFTIAAGGVAFEYKKQ
jgi:hypothetical protein